jgi:hypothetical protein
MRLKAEALGYLESKNNSRCKSNDNSKCNSNSNSNSNSKCNSQYSGPFATLRMTSVWGMRDSVKTNNSKCKSNSNSNSNSQYSGPFAPLRMTSVWGMRDSVKTNNSKCKSKSKCKCKCKCNDNQYGGPFPFGYAQSQDDECLGNDGFCKKQTTASTKVSGYLARVGGVHALHVYGDHEIFLGGDCVDSRFRVRCVNCLDGCGLRLIA